MWGRRSCRGQRNNPHARGLKATRVVVCSRGHWWSLSPVFARERGKFLTSTKRPGFLDARKGVRRNLRMRGNLGVIIGGLAKWKRFLLMKSRGISPTHPPRMFSRTFAKLSISRRRPVSVLLLVQHDLLFQLLDDGIPLNSPGLGR